MVAKRENTGGAGGVTTQVHDRQHHGGHDAARRGPRAGRATTFAGMLCCAAVVGAIGLGAVVTAGSAAADVEHDALVGIGGAPGGQLPFQGQVAGVSADPGTGEILAATTDGTVWAAGGPGTSTADAPRQVAETAASGVVGIAATSTDSGWLATATGDVRAFGAAPDLGAIGTALNAPVVGIEPTPTGLGYWLVAADGGVFVFGDAAFHGSTGHLRINEPIVDLVASADGYLLVAADGGVFVFGEVPFHGSAAAFTLNQPIVAGAAVPGGDGYWLLGADGGVFTFGRVGFVGSGVSTMSSWMASGSVSARAVGIAVAPSGAGYTLAVSVAPEDLSPLADIAPERVAMFDLLATCESTSDWAVNTGNGYYGGLQFRLSTWRAFGGEGMPHEASREEQIAVADRTQQGQGWGAWPRCSRRFGFR